MTQQSEEYQVVVVGGGPSGASVAGILAKRGYRVLVLERENFPRYHVGESMITGMVSIIEQLGLTDRLDAMGFQRKYGLSLVWGRDRTLWDVKFREGGPYAYSYHVSRAEFDELLLNRARELGAAVVEGARVTEPLMDGERVTGVRYVDPEGEPREVHASLVVDASGQARTIVRGRSGLQWQKDLHNIAVWNYFSGCGALPEEQEGNILVEKVDGREGWFWAIPLGADTTSVGYVAPTEHFRENAAIPENAFWDHVPRTRQLARMMENATPQAGFRTGRDWSYTSERFCGPGWAAVGDSACFIDPLLSTGVCLGMLCAGALAYATGLALQTPEHESEIFEQYERGCRIFLTETANYVRFFYDSDRDREDYYQLAQSLRDPENLHAPRSSFVALISGMSGISPLFDFDRFESPVSA